MENALDLPVCDSLYMNKTERFRSKTPALSFLVGILHMIGLLALHDDATGHARGGRPYVYLTTAVLRCFVVRIRMGIPGNNALHYYFSMDTTHGRKTMMACGLHQLAVYYNCIMDNRRPQCIKGMVGNWQLFFNENYARPSVSHKI